MFKKESTVLIAILLIVMVVLSGCSSNTKTNTDSTSPSSSSATTKTEGDATAAKQDLPPVELSFYFPGTVPQFKDKALVEAEINKILKPKINATIKLNPIDWGAYDQKMNVMNGAGEKYDLAFTAPWINNFYQNVAKGSFYPINDLLDKYAPKLKASVPQKIWDASKVNGKIYASINWNVIAVPFGSVIPKKFADKYKIDLSKIKKYEDFEPYLAAFKAGEGYAGVNYYKEVHTFTSQPTYFGYNSIGDDTSAGWVKQDDKDFKVVNQYASNEFKQFVTLMNKWNKFGYIEKDAAISTYAQVQEDQKAGKFRMITLGSPIIPGVEAEVKAGTGIDWLSIALSNATITTSRAIANLIGISASSANPERAMMLLELMNTDKDLYNLISHGIEGKHYKKVSDNLIEPLPVASNGYYPGTDWAFGNQFNGFYTDPTTVGNWDTRQKLNEQADYSPILGFTFNADSVKAELGQVDTVLKQYEDGLLSGTLDPEKSIPEMLDKMNKAGVDKIVAEKQKQLDAWKATQK